MKLSRSGILIRNQAQQIQAIESKSAVTKKHGPLWEKNSSGPKLEEENRQLKDQISLLMAGLENSVPRESYQEAVHRLNVITMALWRTYKVADRLYGAVVATHDPRLLDKALKDYAPALQDAIDDLTKTLDGFNISWHEEPGDVLVECWKVQEAIKATDIDTLRALAAESDPVSPGLIETAKTLWAQQEQALQQERQKHVTEATKEKQRLKELAIRELRRIRAERPRYSVPRLRERYVAKCEGQLETDSLTPEHKEIYDYIKDLSESTLYSWGEI